MTEAISHYNISDNDIVMKMKPDIGIIYPSFYDPDLEIQIVEDIENDKLRLEFVKQEPLMWASAEWAIPGLIAAYIFKPYFESFLKEAGKDHYVLLKNCLHKLLRKNKDSNVKMITSQYSPDKVDASNTQSKAISIHFELKDNKRVKLIFDDALEIDDWTNALDEFLSLVEEQYNGFPEDELTLRLESFSRNPNYEIYALINNQTKEWEFLDQKQIVLRKVNKSRYTRR